MYKIQHIMIFSVSTADEHFLSLLVVLAGLTAIIVLIIRDVQTDKKDKSVAPFEGSGTVGPLSTTTVVLLSVFLLFVFIVLVISIHRARNYLPSRVASVLESIPGLNRLSDFSAKHTSRFKKYAIDKVTMMKAEKLKSKFVEEMTRYMADDHSNLQASFPLKKNKKLQTETAIMNYLRFLVRTSENPSIDEPLRRHAELRLLSFGHFREKLIALNVPMEDISDTFDHFSKPKFLEALKKKMEEYKFHFTPNESNPDVSMRAP